MCSSIENPLNIQPPRTTTLRLTNNAEITILDGMWCSWCGDSIRAVDAEPLENDAVRIICRCGHLVFKFEPRP
jgi:hypothetical protein